MSRKRANFAEMIDCLEQGKESAVEDLVDQYGSHIRRVVRRHLGKRLRVRFDSEDFVQAVWATLFLRPDAFRDIESEKQLIAYLTQIAFHKVIDQRRANTLTEKRDMHREVSLDGGVSETGHPVANDNSPSEFLIANEELAKLQAELPQKLQWMIDCRLQGMTFESIARQGGLHERTVRRLFAKLREKIADS